ncbi:MAG: hypothetical protein KTR27_07530 [Leptolyngbyaceae cyanobacterium MAG.088]|nr:hypothetical protein [Leptolyngbyaceae cyanobacterium MAG.088]
MKNTLISALTVLVATAVIAPTASAVEPANFDLHQQRLEALDRLTKTTVEHKIKVSYLNHESKANNPVENIQDARLNTLDERTKANDPIKNIQEARLSAMDERTKSVVRQ